MTSAYPPGQPSEQRQLVIARAVHRVRERVTAAACAAQRPPQAVAVIAVTKFFPASDVAAVVRSGVAQIGESRHPEARDKLAELADLLNPSLDASAPPRPTLHFIGQVQTNKAAAIATYADVVHSVDRPRLVDALAAGAARRDRPLEVLIQVGLDRSGARGGCAPADVPTLARLIDGSGALVLRGLMAVADPQRPAAGQFAELREISTQLSALHPQATWISAGMSRDLEEAVAHGATHVRVGSAILGERPPRR